MIRKKYIFFTVVLMLAVVAAFMSIPNEEQADDRIILADFVENDLKAIEFENNSESWKLVNNGGWVVEDSEKTSEELVHMIVGSILSFDGKVVSETNNSDNYGLHEPEACVTYIKTNGELVKFYVGNKTVPGTEYYLSTEDGKVYTIYTETGDALKSERYEAEDSFILGIEYNNLNSIEVMGDYSFTLVKGQTSWSFNDGRKKVQIPTDNIKSSVTRGFGGMYSFKAYRTTEKKLVECGLDTPEFSVRLIYNGGEKLLHLGNEDEKGIFIREDDGNEIYYVINDYFEFIKLYREGMF